MQAAPFFQDVAHGPDNGRAVWVTTSDGVRLRVAMWPGGAKGTVLLFPGRTEYVEKYGRTAAELEAIGLSTVTIDWRGQGLADRDLPDRSTGHVNAFADYQTDVAAMLQAVRAQGLPEPWFLLGHSMGGCIGLRSLYEELPVAAVAFTGPMWGIRIRTLLRPMAWGLGWLSQRAGFGHRYAPGTGPATYVLDAPFEDNKLTTDREMYEYMTAQLVGYTDLALGGPSLHWLYEALFETRDLVRRPAPDLPCLTFLGTNERIVDVPRVHRRMDSWPKGELVLIEKGEHEVLMEAPAMRAEVMARLAGHFGRFCG